MTLELDLPANLADLLRAEAEKRGQDVSDFVRLVLEELVTREDTPANPSPNGKPLSVLDQDALEEPTLDEVMDRIWGNIPPEELEKIPSDLSENHDHYIYGTKKRS